MPDLRLDGINREAAEIHRVVRLRDVWMIFLLVLGSAGTAFIHWLNGDAVGWLSRLGMVLFLIAAAAVTYALLRARKVTRLDDWTLRARLEREIEQLQKQSAVGYAVGFWLLAPMVPAIVLSSLGGYHDRTGSYNPSLSLWAYFAVCVAVFALTFRLCHREARRSIDPLLSRLQSLHRELVSESTEPGA